jgi:hypothetical protein
MSVKVKYLQFTKYSRLAISRPAESKALLLKGLSHQFRFARKLYDPICLVWDM